jgi:FlaA1/EpsC-like NDP-sugar epimerase
MMKNKKIMIIGGSGSLGMSLIENLGNDNELHILSTDESKHWAINNRFNELNLNFAIADIRDYDRMNRIILRVNPEIIIIASALKHVDVCELNPKESIETNISGIVNVVNIVEDRQNELTNLETVLMVSTDKACSPINVYGMCKSISERVVLERARHIKNIKFVATRYGNVLETRGSIVPLFMHQAEHNEYFTVTREDMTRFVMTLNDSVNLIVNCIENAKSGETFIPKIKSMNIMDLAEIFSKRYNKEIKIIGIRSGEKLHEDLINETESLRTIECDDIFIVKPIYETKIYNDDVFTYTSSQGTMSKKELEEYLVSVNIFEKDVDSFTQTVKLDDIRKT